MGRVWLVSTEWVILSIWLLKSSCQGHPLVSNHMGHNIFTFFYPLIEISPQTSSPDSLSSVFQSCSFWVPDHLAKLLVTNHESVCTCTSGHCFFQAKWAARCTASSSACWKGFPHHHYSGMSPERVIVLQLSTFGWSLRTVQNHP